MSYFSDEELVRLYVVTQHNSYYNQLYIRYSNKVYQKCLLFSKDPDNAQDLAHDIFFKLISKLSSFRGTAKFSTWLYAVTSNHCAYQLQIEKHRQALYIDSDWLRLDTDADDGVEEELKARHFEWSFQQLTPFEQQMLQMKYQKAISIRAIASLLGTTECSAKMRLKRIRDKLRRNYVKNTTINSFIML